MPGWSGAGYKAGGSTGGRTVIISYMEGYGGPVRNVIALNEEVRAAVDAIAASHRRNRILRG
jgi:hypothetical protein